MTGVYLCDPNKHPKCSKDNCFYWNDDGMCFCTFCPDKAIDGLEHVEITTDNMDKVRKYLFEHRDEIIKKGFDESKTIAVIKLLNYIPKEEKKDDD